MVHDSHADLAVIEGCDVAKLGVAQLIALFGPVRRLSGLLASFEASVNTRLSELHEQGSGAPTADVLTRNAHLSAKEAARRERRAKALAKTKAFADALTKGDVAAEHADVLADLTTKLDTELQAGFFEREQELVAGAVRPSLPQRDRHART